METLFSQAEKQVEGRPESVNLDFDGVKSSYRGLMRIYNQALAQASRLGRTLKDQAEVEGFKGSAASGSVVRLMVGTHIRQRLRELAVGYAQLVPAVDDPARKWLEQAVEDCQEIVGSLPRIQLRPLALALVAPLAAALSKLPGIPDWFVVLMLSLAGAVPGLLVAGFVTVQSSYRFKRALLLPDARVVDELPVDEQKTRTAGNAYEAESQAFGAIGRGKRLEREIDRLLVFLAFILVAEGLVFLSVALSGHSYWWVPLVGALAVTGLYILSQARGRERFWR